MLPAAPPDPDDCKDLAGGIKTACEQGSEGGGGGGQPPESVDPLMNLAKECARAADWTAKQLGKVLTDDRAVDFTNAGFLRQYALVFAASTILTLILWLLAVVKRAVRGVPLGTAFGEAIGLLWIAVAASAFTPLILYTVIGATSAVTDALVEAFNGDTGGTFTKLGADLAAGKVGGGALMLLVVSVVTIALCGALWLLLVIRALALYVGALLGVVVYAGLVDKDLWGKVRRWAGFMLAVIAIEPTIAITLGLSAALEKSEDTSAVTLGLGITVIALGASIYIIARAPGMGDAVKIARQSARTVGLGGRPATASTAQGVQSGINTHSSRTGSTSSSTTGNAGTRKGANGSKPPNRMTEGITTHGPREPKPKKDGGDTK
ncbi:hypothetical protein B7755_052080 [Streptomyces sp. NBS 14/10]|uniref:hypothetical protein n=1 Tax=Streptomyces sp. NBS 14/10 TaxID=1945643 RepID=UPI00117F054D|nr:hypothetical protein [Streptomyces sp. NBS 14/10]KAK1176688.1 hypothetical protein B7755_052080 [Streptomyces sp. NBS 14/10]